MWKTYLVSIRLSNILSATERLNSGSTRGQLFQLNVRKNYKIFKENKNFENKKYENLF